ncbi:MAG: aldo/keto reductase [Rhodobacteraceae bacterium]|nr:MAG: aldo/keto reductase [Paracoccaceae bacterium]
MRYKLLGHSGLRVSELALGTMNFGDDKPWAVADADTQDILASFADHGGTMIDTAPNYAGGRAESLVGEYTQKARDRFVLSTKYTASTEGHVMAGGNSARTMIRSVEDSLTRLKTDYIDLFWLHFWDGTTPMDEIMRAFDTLVASGKVRYVGLSDVPAWLVSRAVTLTEMRGWARPVAVQVEYSLAAREAEREFLPMARALDLGVVGWGALAAGALSGGADPRRRPKDKIPGHVQKAVEAAQAVADDAGLSLRDVALRWLLRGEEAANVVPLIGARTAAQLGETLAAADGALERDVTDALSKATAPRLGFPHDLIASSYLRRFAFGKDNELLPFPPRA